NRLIEVLSADPILVIIDEVDHMLHNWKNIETLRDVHDESGSCFLLIGMGEAEQKLEGFPHLYSRFADVIRAKPIYQDEILEISKKIAEVPLSEPAAERLYEVTHGEFRNDCYLDASFGA